MNMYLFCPWWPVQPTPHYTPPTHTATLPPGYHFTCTTTTCPTHCYRTTPHHCPRAPQKTSYLRHTLPATHCTDGEGRRSTILPVFPTCLYALPHTHTTAPPHHTHWRIHLATHLTSRATLHALELGTWKGALPPDYRRRLP